jgi:hypothetical protein
MCIGKDEIWQTSSILFTVNVILRYFDELLNMHKFTEIITVHLTTKSKCYISRLVLSYDQIFTELKHLRGNLTDVGLL